MNLASNHLPLIAPPLARAVLSGPLRVLCLLYLCLSPACRRPSDEQGRPTRASYALAAVEGYVVKPTRLDADLTAAGTLLPAEETTLYPETAGRVVMLHLPEGRAVRQGDLLLKLFDEDLQAQLKKAEAQLQQARLTEQRLGELLKVKGVSQQEYDAAALQVRVLESDIDLTRAQLRKTEVRAPYSGVIGLRQISLGAYVSPATPITTLRATHPLRLDFSVPEQFATLVRAGQRVTFRVQGQTRTYSATVIASEPAISAEARTLKVRATVASSAQTTLTPGMFAEVSLQLQTRNDALLIPAQAIVPKSRDKIVFVSRNGQAVPTVVKTGARQADKVEIIEGLQPGDTIAVTGTLFLRPNTPLRFGKITE
ncbi:MAG: efflux RND transporter periplasmic adaptor subunit [Saprospiraceae bacterium]|nr:efflux RND transporter periplasmic adaptor subunit [Saprospiraceae bacterium]MDW8230711.1 efflux RND transporter periplasmic adaptor subunit [Saprospiraceae bacterium]